MLGSLSPAPFPRLYKYGGGDADRLQWLERLLIHHELYAPLASQLNDLREARPPLKPLSVEGYAELLKRSVQIGDPRMSKAARLQIHRQINEVTASLGVDKLREITTEKLHEMLIRYRIYSLSRRWNNLSMWHWYGDHHRGYCVEFSNLRAPVAIRAVSYTNPPPFDVLRFSPDSAELFFMKSPDWSNEEEVRMALPRTLGGPVFQLDPHEITRVFVGKDMPPENVERIREYGRTRVPPIPVLSLRWDEIEANLAIVDPPPVPDSPEG